MGSSGGVSKFFEFGDLNHGNEAVICSDSRLEVIVITVGHFGVRESIIGYEISSEPSLSEHRYILFTLQCSVKIHLIRDARGINWASLERT